MLPSKDWPLRSEPMERRQLGLGVEAGEVVRGCGSKRCCESLGWRGWGECSRLSKLPLRVGVQGKRWG